ncbi:hypothetical protein MAPG_02334 [Magnaporthiopsis poae ATCC 64411]|uniref:Uncharacterized protein n=1 Tax=Magnaporthiopsis poae (strain ATCC 64411 / 73-15) TaxID=644358 RepID=A0A0C4DR33_MAGP6|nr:hypothetical protein MAPG_02334 [Magnaporthiopsis poae ATCC 64411]
MNLLELPDKIVHGIFVVDMASCKLPRTVRLRLVKKLFAELEFATVTDPETGPNDELLDSRHAVHGEAAVAGMAAREVLECHDNHQRRTSAKTPLEAAA